MNFRNIIFDAGSVLVNWNRYYLYTVVFGGDAERAAHFCKNVVTDEWNDVTDSGRPLGECLQQLYLQHPDAHTYISAYWNCYKDMDGGEVPGMYDLLLKLKGKGLHLFCLTNWSAETFPIVKEVNHRLFSFFEGIVVSGEEKIMKPDAGIYELILKRYGLDREESLFVDDRQKNVDGALAVGLPAERFIDAENLKGRLEALNVL